MQKSQFLKKMCKESNCVPFVADLFLIRYVRDFMRSQERKHNENTPMQYTAIFHLCKNLNFQMKKYDIFLIFAQNMYRE